MERNDWHGLADLGNSEQRKKLLDRAAELFEKKGYKKTKLDDIASVSGRGKTIIYYYFQNKKSILTAVIEDKITQIYQDVEYHTLQGCTVTELGIKQDFALDTHEAMMRYVEKIVEIGDNFLQKYDKILHEYASFQKLIQSAIRIFKERNTTLLEAVLRKGVDNGDIEMQAKDIPLISYGIFRICLSYYTDIMQGINFSIGVKELQRIVTLFLWSKEPD